MGRISPNLLGEIRRSPSRVSCPPPYGGSRSLITELLYTYMEHATLKLLYTYMEHATLKLTNIATLILSNIATL